MARERMANRSCLNCGTMFRPKERKAKYCRVECFYEYRRKARQTPCKVCGKLFDRAIKSQKVCGYECADKLKKAKKEVTCEQCGTVFERPHGKRRRFCSRSCSMKSRNAVSTVAKPEGSTRKDGNGYIVEKTENGWIAQHRLVMEQVIGRPLKKSERVHHKNGKRDDNRPENLELWTGTGTSKKDPHGIRIVDKVIDLLDSLTPAERRKVEKRIKELDK